MESHTSEQFINEMLNAECWFCSRLSLQWDSQP